MRMVDTSVGSTLEVPNFLKFECKYILNKITIALYNIIRYNKY